MDGEITEDELAYFEMLDVEFVTQLLLLNDRLSRHISVYSASPFASTREMVEYAGWIVQADP